MQLADISQCEKIESVEHYLCKYPTHIKARSKLLGAGAYDLPYDINTIWNLP